MSQVTAKTPSLEKRAQDDKARLGLWIYIMCDLVLFSTLFAAFLILRPATAGGVAGRDIFEMPLVLVETILLLVSSITVGVAYLAAQTNRLKLHRIMMMATILLGAGFLAIELYEFSVLIAEGHTWAKSAFLSSFFTLVGTHGAHIAVGLIWALTLLITGFRRGVTVDIVRKTGLFSMFWHFLDIVWIFIFTVVYLMGVM